MPTQKFINLTDSKKKTILTAMCREFMNIPYSEIRISSLIQKAGISRASFYLYFDDKEDLLNCIAESWVEAILEKLAEAFKQSDGSYYESMKFWMSQALENDISREVWKVYKRVMEEEDFTKKSKLGALQFKESPRWRQTIEECFGYMDQSKYPGLTPEKLAYAVDMGLLAMIQLSMRYVEQYAPLTELKEAAWHQLTILDKGIRG